MRNGILLAIALGLTLATYLVYELPQRHLERGHVAQPLFDLQEWQARWGALHAIETPAVKAQVDQIGREDWQRFLGDLESAFVERALPRDQVNPSMRDSFFPRREWVMRFLFERGSVSVLLGAKLPFAHSFYVAIALPEGGESWVVANDSRSARGAYPAGQAHRHDLKYQRLKGLYYRNLLEKE